MSILPFKLLYLFSDFVYFILYPVAGYRKKVVGENLERSFPEKTNDQIAALKRRYYHYLCDLFVETVKTRAIGSKRMLQHCNMDESTHLLFDRLYEEKKTGLIVMGHKGNWEWSGNALALQCHQPLYVVYHPLSNKKFDQLLYRIRTRFGIRLIPMREAYHHLKHMENETLLSGFIADQSPDPRAAYWTRFMNQDTPFFRGPERIAFKLNQPVLYATLHREKRGYYRLHVEIMIAEPRLCQEGEITEMYAQWLEKDIRSQPETWLWSHRRWKHKRPLATGAPAVNGVA